MGLGWQGFRVIGVDNSWVAYGGGTINRNGCSPGDRRDGKGIGVVEIKLERG